MRSLAIIGLLAASLSLASARSPFEAAISERWDSLRFTFASLQSDYAVEFPLFVLYRLKDGGQLISYNGDKVSTRRVEPPEFERIKNQLLLSFADTPKQSPSFVSPDPPELIMSLCVDRGLNRSAFERRLKPNDQSKAFEVFSTLIQELTQ
jgi:hypothetical protein